jgi:ABC-type transport system involved in cytochrome bd biosynthesis fused ATPase/permease subunit
LAKIRVNPRKISLNRKVDPDRTLTLTETVNGQNKARRCLMAGFLGAFLVLTPTLFTACHTTPEQAAFATLQEIANTADKTLSAYYDLVVAGKVDQPTQARVRDIKERYQKAMNAAVTAARGNTWTTAPEDVQRLAALLADIVKATR